VENRGGCGDGDRIELAGHGRQGLLPFAQTEGPFDGGAAGDVRGIGDAPQLVATIDGIPVDRDAGQSVALGVEYLDDDRVCQRPPRVPACVAGESRRISAGQFSNAFR
jgi:hypothetical protein